MANNTGWSSSFLAVILGCGDAGGGSAGSTGGPTTLPDPTTPTSDTGTSPTTSDGTTAGSATGGASTSTGTTLSTSTTATTGPLSATATEGDTTTSTTTLPGETTTSTSTGPDLDTGTTGCPDVGMGDVEFTYIWIANSPQGTVSKIDTQTMQEVGRYQVRPQGGGEPSRTSVNLHGDMVIGSRLGGVTKIWARPEDCQESNGQPGIQTSTGKNDVLPWGQEECIAWYTDYSFVSERAVAWTTGDLNMQSCEFEGRQGVDRRDHRRPQPPRPAPQRRHRRAGELRRHPRHHGAVGAQPLRRGPSTPTTTCGWSTPYCGGTLIEVHEDMTYDTVAMPAAICPYGIAVDSKGYVWIGGYQTFTGRYDPINGTWDMIAAQGLGIQGGRREPPVARRLRAKRRDRDRRQHPCRSSAPPPVPTTGQSKGIGIDFFGFVWIVSDAGTTVVRMDPDTKQIQTYTGLNDPYSYSDMTGWGLKNAVLPQ
jgi:hypothetical protein